MTDFMTKLLSANRIKDTEHKIIKQCISDLLAAGFWLNVDNGGTSFEIPWTQDPDKVFASMGHTEDETICAREQPDKPDRKWVRFVYGNDGWDVINNYPCSLEEILAPTNALIEELSECGVASDAK